MEIHDKDFEIEQKKSTTSIIIEKLLNLLRDRSLKAGDRLPPERELAEIMKVSRPSLREALKSLETMNIIRIRQGLGAFVNKLEPESIVEHLDIVFTLDNTLYHDLYKARRVLESAIARIAAENISDDELEMIEENIAKAVESVQMPQEFLELDFQLHSLILKASKNRILPVFIQSINKLNLMMREKTNSILSIRQSTLVDHQKILTALKMKNPEMAAKAMEEHLLNVENGFYQTVESGGSET
jgi:GntR family transcriptional repressor for pyruvate dehydrogenase complex